MDNHMCQDRPQHCIQVCLYIQSGQTLFTVNSDLKWATHDLNRSDCTTFHSLSFLSASHPLIPYSVSPFIFVFLFHLYFSCYAFLVFPTPFFPSYLLIKVFVFTLFSCPSLYIFDVLQSYCTCMNRLLGTVLKRHLLHRKEKTLTEIVIVTIVEKYRYRGTNVNIIICPLSSPQSHETPRKE